MCRRCNFMESCPSFNFNYGTGELQDKFGMKKYTNTENLGSTLVYTMLKEVSDFCDPSIKENWSLKAHQQVIIAIVFAAPTLQL